ncbi:MAG: DUF1599 domain-containing protein, partial [Flavobacteriales bacterium]
MSSDTLTRAKPILKRSREIFAAKMEDYGPSWRVLRPASVLDQILIKVRRIRNLQEKEERKVDEGIVPELYGVINYCIIALIQSEEGASDTTDLSVDESLARYERFSGEVLSLMERKNHDYGEAWKEMKLRSIVDMILVKLIRNERLLAENEAAKSSEGPDANYFDIINYAIFALLKL